MPPRTHLARISALLYCGKVSIFFFERSASAPWSKMENVFFYFLEELPPHLLIIMLYLSRCCNRKKLHSWEWNAFITVYQVRTMQFEKSFRGIDFGAHTAGILCTFVLFEDQGMSGAGEGEHAGVADCGEEKNWIENVLFSIIQRIWVTVSLSVFCRVVDSLVFTSVDRLDELIRCRALIYSSCRRDEKESG